MIILNSPNNPTGTVYTREELEELTNLVVENNIYILFDEIYKLKRVVRAALQMVI